MPAGGKGKMRRKKNKLPQQKGVVQIEKDEAWETVTHQKVHSGYSLFVQLQ